MHVWPTSAGRNWGYGSATAVRSGAIQMRLERMNRIVEVNERLAYAVVEPGAARARARRHRAIGDAHLNDVVTLAVLDRYPSDEAHASRLPDGVRAAMCRRLAVPAWSFGGGLQGTRAMVRAMKAEVARRLAPKGSRATISFGTRISNRARKSQRSRTPIATDAA